MTQSAIALPDRFRPCGVAMLLGSSGVCRVFLCDRKNHFVDVVDEQARPLFSFGGHGVGPGQFADPCDIVVVIPDDQTPCSPEHALMVAVADRGNHRIQIFDASGTLVALLGPAALASSDAGVACRLIRAAVPASMTRLAWAAPHLEITDDRGGTVRIDLGREFLPVSRSTTARSAIRGVLRRALADQAFGEALPQRGGRASAFPIA